MQDKDKAVFIFWDDKMATGIDIIDEQHRELLRLTNELYDTCRQGREMANEGFKKTAHALVEYVGVHFSTEEQLMERSGYPRYAEHKQEHQEFARQVLEDVGNYEKGKAFVPNNFVHFLRNWVMQHIALTDKKVGEYLFKHKR